MEKRNVMGERNVLGGRNVMEERDMMGKRDVRHVKISQSDTKGGGMQPEP